MGSDTLRTVGTRLGPYVWHPSNELQWWRTLGKPTHPPNLEGSHRPLEDPLRGRTSRNPRDSCPRQPHSRHRNWHHVRLLHPTRQCGPQTASRLNRNNQTTETQTEKSLDQTSQTPNHHGYTACQTPNNDNASTRDPLPTIFIHNQYMNPGLSKDPNCP